jgi:4-hydroxy-tetrahydrodipicolinate synthase
MKSIYHICHNATTFAKDGQIDEDAYRQSLQRLVDARIGVYAAGGSGECYALTRDEIGRLYDIAVEMCRGKVPVGSNQLEQHTARASLELAQFAARHKVDICSIYGPAGWHGYRATGAEYLNYFDRILSELKHPVALCPNPIIGYRPAPEVIAAICDKYGQVEAVNLTGVTGDDYFIRLKDELKRDVDIHVTIVGSLNTLGLGAAGLVGAESNLLPRTVRRYMDLYEAGRWGELATVYADLRRFSAFVQPWKSATPRWIKMAFAVFKLPGGEGGTREPYLPPTEADLARFAAGALALDIPEINDMAKAAGLTG